MLTYGDAHNVVFTQYFLLESYHLINFLLTCSLKHCLYGGLKDRYVKYYS